MKAVLHLFGRVLMGLGVLLLAGAAAAGAAVATGRVPKDRLQAAVEALKGRTAPAPEPKPAQPEGPEVLVAARTKLEADRRALEEERALVLAQLSAERAEIEALKNAAEERLAELARPRPDAAAEASPSGTPPASGASAPASEKGLKAVSEMLGKMSPKDAALLLSGQDDADAARILRRMDAKQAGKVMAALVASDAARAGRITALLRQSAQ